MHPETAMREVGDVPVQVRAERLDLAASDIDRS
jgi:hypothetical protein